MTREALRDLWVAAIAIAVFVMFDRAAAALGSTRGEAGFAVCAIVLLLVLGAEGLLTRAPIGAALRALGLGLPAPPALGLAVALCVLLLAFFPIFSAAAASPLALRTEWPVLALGMLAQGGVAEETLFRGFLFRHLRQRRPGSTRAPRCRSRSAGWSSAPRRLGSCLRCQCVRPRTAARRRPRAKRAGRRGRSRAGPHVGAQCFCSSASCPAAVLPGRPAVDDCACERER